MVPKLYTFKDHSYNYIKIAGHQFRYSWEETEEVFMIESFIECILLIESGKGKRVLFVPCPLDC